MRSNRRFVSLLSIAVICAITVATAGMSAPAKEGELAQRQATKWVAAHPLGDLTLDALMLYPQRYQKTLVRSLRPNEVKVLWREHFETYLLASNGTQAARAMNSDLGHSLNSEQRTVLQVAIDSLDRIFDARTSIQKRQHVAASICSLAKKQFTREDGYRLFVRLGPPTSSKQPSSIRATTKAMIGGEAVGLAKYLAALAGLREPTMLSCDCHANSWCNILDCYECPLADKPFGCGCFGLYLCDGTTLT